MKSTFVNVMTEELALHTAARRYCEERAAYWHTRYAELGSHIDRSGYTTEQKNIFPRYNVLEAILVEVKRFCPESFTSSEEAREMLILAGWGGERPSRCGGVVNAGGTEKVRPARAGETATPGETTA